MSLRVVVRSPAETDLLESALFIAEDNPAAAQRFLDEAEKAFARLAEFPAYPKLFAPSTRRGILILGSPTQCPR